MPGFLERLRATTPPAFVATYAMNGKRREQPCATLAEALSYLAERHEPLAVEGDGLFICGLELHKRLEPLIRKQATIRDGWPIGAPFDR